MRAHKKKDRQLAAILLLTCIIASLAILMQSSDAKQEVFFADQYIQHVVTPGETLWGIARHYRPDADPRQIVFEIQKVSGISPVIRPGQVIWVPMTSNHRGGEARCLGDT